MTKERRLGRGLEALLGQLPGWGSTPAPGAAVPQPAPTAETEDHNTSSALPPFATIPHHVTPPTPAAEFVVDPAPPVMSAPELPHVATAAEPLYSSPAPTHGADPGSLKMVAIALIEHNPNQPRQEFDPDEIRRLADSIAEHGLLQPVVVRRLDDHYQLIAGERRLRAARLAGWLDVPVNVVEADSRQTAELAIVENMQRKDLNALEKAASFQRYLEEYGGTQEELAGRLKLDRSTIANLIRLLELPDTVQDALRRGKITQGHARALLPLGEEREQVAFCERIQTEGLNVRQTESFVQDAVANVSSGSLSVIGVDGKKSKARRGRTENLAALEQEFRAVLGLRVKITHDARGRGKVVIQFSDHDEFEQLRRQICEPGGRPIAQVVG